MKRPIKFRGRDTTGIMRFGYYFMVDGYQYIIEEHTWCEVDPESVAQLVGYDANGNEVYEGDTIVDDIAEYVAHLFASVLISDCKLKEATT